LHAIFLDGVYVRDRAGVAPTFHVLPALSTSEVADVMQVVDDNFAIREPALAQLATAAVTGLPPAGPERRHRAEITLRGRPGTVTTAPLCVAELGFSLHAATRAAAEDKRGREALVRYVLRPPIAGEHLQPGTDGRVRIELKRRFRDGTNAIELDPLSLLCRLAAAVPPPRFHTVRYAGVLGAASAWRSEVIPAPKPTPVETAAPATPAGDAPQSQPPRGGARSHYRPWIELIRRAFAVDPTICRCGGRMKLLALVKGPESIARFLRHLGEPTEPPRRAAARDPPYARSPVVRRKESDGPELFGA
jgi:hypothetical protein